MHWIFNDREIKELTGHLRLEVSDSSGIVVMFSEGRLNEYIWSHWLTAARMYHQSALDDHSALEFKPRESEEYTLSVKYKADPKLMGHTGFCDLTCAWPK